jgi:hypothetical protein
MIAILVPLLAGALQGDGEKKAASGAVLERTVLLTLTDVLGRRREIARREVVRVKGASLSITDLTFGERLIVRPDLKKLWRADPLGGTYSEYTFEEAAAIRRARLDELRAARARVPGTAEEKELGAILEGFDQFEAAPAVAVVQGPPLRITVNGLVRAEISRIDGQLQTPAWFDALAAVEAFPPAVRDQLKGLGGVPMKGKLRYVLFLDRVTEEFEITSARAEEVADAEFEPPAGLRKVALKEFEREPERKLEKPKEFRRDFKEDEADRREREGEFKKEPPKGEKK